jgi:GWxTD domain-containing protein
MRRALLIVGILGSTAFPALGDGDESAVALKEWVRGPVRYLITRDEERAFKKLDNDDARASFVERFWSRRDPTPDTWFNEYRQAFWQRVTEANEKFLDSAGPGWKTDRGKIYILYGPPEKIQEDSDADVQGLEPTATRGLVRWIYESRPGGRKDLPNIVVVAFVRTTTGEMKLSSDPRLASIFFDPRLLAERHSPNAWDRYRAENPGTGTRLDVMLDLGKMQEVPPQEQLLLERVETRETYAQRPLIVRLDRYQPEGMAGTLTVATLDLPPSDDLPALVVRFTPRDAGRTPKILAEGSFRIERGARGRVAEGRVALEPGTWDVLALAVDPSESANRIWKGSVTVTAPTPTLRLSDPVLAWRVEPLEYRGLTGYDAPFTFGGFRIVPRLTPEIARGEPVQVFLEAYGGKAPYEGTFALEGREDDGRFTPLGAPQRFVQPSGSFAWSLPTGASWPLGDYRVRIEVRDADGAVAAAVVAFRLGEHE